MPYNSRIAIISFLCLMLLSSCDKTEEIVPGHDAPQWTEDQQSMVDQLSEVAVEVDTQSLLIEDDDLRWLDDLSEKRVIGLGEATHGTKEFFQMKGRIFSYLAENHRYKTFGFEADFAESFYINQYVQGGPGDLTNIMDQHMHFWTWRTIEVRDILQWMRSFNEMQVEESPLQYIGFDCQYMTYQPILLSTYLSDVLPGIDERIGLAIAPILAENEANFKSISADELQVWMDTLVILEDVIESYREILVAASNPLTFELHKHLLRSLSQVMQTKYYSAQTANAYNWRDDFMAENILWYQNLFGADNKMCVWAHNAHVAINPGYGGGGAMGYHLNRALRSDYEVIAFGFTNGRFTAVKKSASRYLGLRSHTINDAPRVRSFNFLFDRVPQRAFTVDLDKLDTNRVWREFLNETHQFLEIGSVFTGIARDYYRHVDLDTYYHRIIYYKRTAAAEQL